MLAIGFHRTAAGALAMLALACVAPAARDAARPPPASPPQAEAPATAHIAAPAAVPAETAPPPEHAPAAPGELVTEKDAHRHLLRLHVGFYEPRHKDGKVYSPSDGYLAPVAATSDGGFVFGGQAEMPDGAARPVIGKIDRQGNVLWQVTLDRSIYRAYEGGLVHETADGNYVGFVMSYIEESGFPVHSFAKVSPSGAVIWKLELPRDRYGNTPQVHLARVTSDGSVTLSGHLYEGRRGNGDRPAYRWTARITSDGKIRDAASGAPLDWAKDDW